MTMLKTFENYINLKKKQKTYLVYRNGKHIDTVFYDINSNVTSNDVKKSLIDHDNYPSDIKVYRKAE